MKGALSFKLKELFGIDLRSLALFRVGLGLVLIYDLIVRSTALTAHYSDFGILPRQALLEKFPFVAQFSLHLINGSPLFQALLMLLTAAAAFSLLIGYRTRLATLIAWILLISLHNRNPMILQRGDILLRMFLFWGLFLPLGARFSVDARLNASKEKPPDRIFSAATVALLLQICFVYWFTLGLKSGSVWWEKGMAIEYALRIDQMVKPFGRFLLEVPNLLPLFTRATVLLEGLGPLLAFFPIYNSFFRGLAVLLFILFHFGLWLSLNLGVFPYASIVGWFVFLPSPFWEKIAPRFSLPEGGRRRVQRWTESFIQFFKTRNLKGSSSYFTLSHGAQVFAALCLVYVFLWNVRTLNFNKYSRFFPPLLSGPGDLLRIDQLWDMFSPSPLREDGWYIIPGKLKDGTEVDLFRNGQPVNSNKPFPISKDYPIERWQKYMMSLAQTNFSDHRLFYARYLCRLWNESHPPSQQVESFEIDFIMELTELNGREAPPQKMMLWKHQCF